MPGHRWQWHNRIIPKPAMHDPQSAALPGKHPPVLREQEYFLLRFCFWIFPLLYLVTGRCMANALPLAPASAASTRVALAAGPTCPPASGKNYSGQNLTDTNFSAAIPGSLVGANFSNAILKGTIFANQDLTGASFQGADLGPSDKGSVDFTNTTLTNTCFIQATMNATDFTFANFHCTDFSNTSLIQAQFGPSQNIAADTRCRTKFVGSAIDVHVISTDNWGRVDFTNASFQNLSPSTFSLAGKDITGAMLGGTDFSNIDMTGANLTLVDFSNATLARANLTGTALNGAKLAGVKAPYVTLDCAQFYGVSSQARSCGTPVGPPCPSVPVSSAPTASADLTQANLQGASLINTVLDSATLAGANLSGTTARQSSFRNASLEASGNINVAGVQGANLWGANFQNAHINFVQFNNTTLADACFDQKTTLNGTSFNGSIMPGATFDSATLEGVSFNATILENAVFTNAILKTPPDGGSAVNFSCAQLGGGNFQNAHVFAANFQAAVMPPAAACCPQPGGGAWCGTIDITQQAYGGVTYPTLTSSVTCPNGDVAQCSQAQWEIPGWQTNLCSSHHTTETVWSKPDCGGSPGDMVKFNDMNLKACILATLPGQPSSIAVTTAATLLEISCPGLGITDLTGLQDFTGLTSLNLSGNQIGQFNLPLTQLQNLKLGSNQLTALDASKLANLVNLDVSHNQLQSIVGLVAINPLVLDLSYNQLTSFDLPIFDGLVFVDLSHNALTGVLDSYQKNLSALASLSYLDLSYNSIPTIGDASSIAQTGALNSLYLECNPTFDCASLNLTGSSSALQKSRCAQFNSQSGEWILQPHPSCPTNQARQARGMALPRLGRFEAKPEPVHEFCPFLTTINKDEP